MFQQLPDLTDCLLGGDGHQVRLCDHLVMFSVINLIGTRISRPPRVPQQEDQSADIVGVVQPWAHRRAALHRAYVRGRARDAGP